MAKYEQQMAQLAADEAESDDEFIALEIKTKINEYKKAQSCEEISQDLLSEAVRWRLSQNDCQNRGYVLDGYPISYQTTRDVFYITPEPPKKKAAPKEGEEGEEEAPVEEEPAEEDDEEAKKKYAPKFQQHIYPDSVIMCKGEHSVLLKRWRDLGDSRDFEAIFKKYNDDNNLTEDGTPRPAENPGHPKAPKHVYPLSRFFQEHKTEIFEINTDGSEFETKQSMEIYIERNGRSFNYLQSVQKLNGVRE